MKTELMLTDRDTTYEKVCHILREAILKGDFKPGDRLVQTELADAIGVSRMPVREALRKLEVEGLIEIVPHRGAVVKPFNTEDIREIYALRAQLEKMAVELSAERMTVSDMDQLENLAETMEEAGDASVFVENNILFHRLLIKRCPWPRLTGFIETLWNGFPQQTPHILDKQIEKSNLEHRDILEAIKRKDAHHAANLVASHISRTGYTLVARLKELQK